MPDEKLQNLYDSLWYGCSKPVFDLYQNKIVALSTQDAAIKSLIEALERGNADVPLAGWASVKPVALDDIPGPIDLSKYPHKCPKCKSPAYIGFNSTECSGGCK